MHFSIGDLGVILHDDINVTVIHPSNPEIAFTELGKALIMKTNEILEIIHCPNNTKRYRRGLRCEDFENSADLLALIV